MKQQSTLTLAQRTARRRMMARQRQRGPSVAARVALIIFLLLLLVAGFNGIVLTGSSGVAAYNVNQYYNTLVPTGIQTLKAVEAAPNQSTRILDRNGRLLAELYDPSVGQHQFVALAKISPWVKQATVAMEDPTFWTNPGFDPRGIVRALYEDLRYHQTQGGSGITQQLAKLSITGNDPTVQRKLKELMLSVGITKSFSKPQILEMYLNTIFYGNQSYGIQQAAHVYFHKSADKLDLAQAAFLAGLPQGPSIYDPLVYPEAALQRQNQMLTQMVKQNMITEDQKAQAIAEAQTFRFTPPPGRKSVIYAPHFVEFVKEQLINTLGAERVYRGGLVVTTTLDLRLNTIAQELIKQQTTQLTANGNNATDGALVAIDPHTREIEAMVGSADFNDNSIAGQVNMATAPRQPGSSFKPFSYVTAFEKGWFPGMVINDAPVSFPQNDGTLYVPHNYDKQWHGAITLRFALANSLNIPAIKTLVYAGIPDVLKTARDFGITTLKSASHYGPSLVLGAGEIPLLQMTNAYAVFATGGMYQKYQFIRSMTDGFGQPVNFPQGDPPRRVLSAQYAYLITSILQDGQARSYEFGLQNPLVLSDRPAAVKTGTTDSFRDNLTIGYTPDLVTGVWVGNANNDQMINVIGITGAGPVWQDFMGQALAQTPAHDFVAPPGIITTTVSGYSGKLATPSTSWPIRDVFAAGAVPHQFDSPALSDWTLQRRLFLQMSVDGSLYGPPAGTTSSSSSSGGLSGPGTFTSKTLLQDPCHGQSYHYITTADGGYQYTCG